MSDVKKWVDIRRDLRVIAAVAPLTLARAPHSSFRHLAGECWRL